MKFTITGNFSDLPILKLDSNVIKYGNLSLYASEPFSFKNEAGATVNYPAKHSMDFSVTEDVGNLKKNTWYRASASVDGELTLKEIKPVTANDSTEPKTCADCEKPMADCTCDETEAAKAIQSPPVVNVVLDKGQEIIVDEKGKRVDQYLKLPKDNSEAKLGLIAYREDVWPNSREYKRRIMEDIARNAANSVK